MRWCHRLIVAIVRARAIFSFIHFKFYRHFIAKEKLHKNGLESYMDAAARLFEVVEEGNVVQVQPSWVFEESLESLGTKFPLIPGSQGSIVFCTTTLSSKVRWLQFEIRLVTCISCCFPVFLRHSVLSFYFSHFIKQESSVFLARNEPQNWLFLATYCVAMLCRIAVFAFENGSGCNNCA